MTVRINNFEQSSDSTEIYATKLANMGTTFATFGNDLQANAAGITLERLEKLKNTDSIESDNMQKQIDNLDELINKIILFSEDVIKTID